MQIQTHKDNYMLININENNTNMKKAHIESRVINIEL